MRAQPFYVIVGDSSAVTRRWIVCVCLEQEEATQKVHALTKQRDAFLKARAAFDKERQQAAVAWHERHRQSGGSSSIMYSGGGGITFGMAGQTVTAMVQDAPMMTGSVSFGMLGAPPMPPSARFPSKKEAQLEWKADDEKLRGQLRTLVDKLRMMDRWFSWVRRDRIVPTYTIEKSSDDPHTDPGPEGEW